MSGTGLCRGTKLDQRTLSVTTSFFLIFHSGEQKDPRMGAVLKQSTTILIVSTIANLLAGVALGLMDNLYTLLPGLLQKAATALPFRYMIGFPVEVLTGQLSTAEIWTGFAFQAGWLAVALVLFAILWRAGVKRYSAVGG